MIKFNKKYMLDHFPTLIIAIYLFVIFALALNIGISFSSIINDSLIKFGMNLIFVLSLIPMINCGIGLNFGMSIGISAGLIGMCIALQLNLKSWMGFIVAIFISILVSILFGYIYGNILNKLKGKEDIAAVFIGYAFVPLMNIFWLIMPFSNRKMLYPVGGKGLRPKINLAENFGNILDDFLLIKFKNIVIPLGFILFVLFISFTIYIMYRNRLGHNMVAVKENSKFAYISGIDINKTRIISVIVSTALASIGICVYSQSYGFIQLYDGTNIMAFPAISAILIGGATGNKASIKNAIIGTYLYQMVFLLSVPVANQLLIPELAEIMRMILTNGIILFAFLWQRGNLNEQKANV